MNKIITIIFACSVLCASEIGSSILLPGLGERKLGHYEQSKKFMISEVLTWTSLFIFDEFSSSYKSDFRNHAVMYASVDWSNKNDTFAANVGNFNSMQDYNEYQAWIGNWDGMYEDNGQFHWDWNNDSVTRNKYDAWRNKSSNYKEYQEFAVAALILNRMISMFNVLNIENNSKVSSNIIKNSDKSLDLIINFHF